MTLERSSLKIGCRPPARSMMLRRRMPSPTGPSTYVPSSSGPRWRIVPHIRRITATETGRPGSACAMPTMPHIRGGGAARPGPPADAAGRAAALRARHMSGLATVTTRLASWARSLLAVGVPRCGAWDDGGLPVGAVWGWRGCLLYLSGLSPPADDPGRRAAPAPSGRPPDRVAEDQHPPPRLQRGSGHPRHAGEPAPARLSGRAAPDPRGVGRFDGPHRRDRGRVREPRRRAAAAAAPSREDGRRKRGAPGVTG